MTQEVLLRLALKAGRTKLKTGWRSHIWTTSLVPRLIVAWAASACGLQLRTLLYTIFSCSRLWTTAGALEVLVPLDAWAVVSGVGMSLVQRIFRSQWAGRACLMEAWRKHPFLDTLVPVGAGRYGTTVVTFLSSVWKGSSDCQGTACEGAVNSGLRMFDREEQRVQLLGISTIFYVW